MERVLELISKLVAELGTVVEPVPPQRSAESVPGQLMEMLQRIRREHTNRFVDEREICNLDLKIKSCSRELNKHGASIERDRRILEEEQSKNVRRSAELKEALEEQKKVDENLKRLVESQKSEKKESLRQVTEIEQRLRKDRGDNELEGDCVDSAQKELDEMTEKYDDLNELYQQLISKECQMNDDLQEAKKALIESLKRNEELKKAIEQQRKADENLLNLLKEQQREKDESLKRITELKRVSLVDEVTKKYKDLQEEYDDLLDLCQQLRIKEHHSNDNFQEVRRALIEGLRDVPSGSCVTIGVKSMGEIDLKAFHEVCKKRFSPPHEAFIRALDMFYTWKEKTRNPNWHPFRIVTDEWGNHRREIDEDDESLVGLLEEWGDGVYNSVTKALIELQDYNPSGCYPVPELWNFKEDREVTVGEVIQHVFDQQKKAKHRRSR